MRFQWHAAISGLTLGVQLLLLASASAAPAPLRYDVSVHPDLRSFDVKLCFQDVPARRLEAADPRSLEVIHGLESGSGARLQLDRGVLRIDGLKPGGCISYGVNLAPVLNTEEQRYHRRAAVVVGKDLMVAPALWLWRPVSAVGAVDAEVHFDLPVGIRISAPWRLLERTPRGASYLTGTTPADWNAAIAIGSFDIDDVVVPGARLRVAVLDGRPQPNVAALAQWISQAALTVVEMYGRFPLSDVQILIVPVTHADEPVPFAQVLRGGGSAIRFFIDTRYPIEELIRDWTAVHELSHLVHPYFSDSDVWIAEGIASYYQNVLRARSGILTPQEAWQKLHEGFQRGIDATDGRALSEVAEFMHRDGAYMRVYWSGAAVALLADLALRTRSDGSQSLDTVLSAFQNCCLPAQRLWSAREFFHRLDKLSSSKIFSELYRRYGHSGDFPDLHEAYQSLGLDPSGPSIRFVDGASAAIHRDAIMRGTYTPGPG